MEKIVIKVEFRLATKKGEATKSTITPIKGGKPLSAAGTRMRGALCIAISHAVANIFGAPSKASVTATLED